MYVVNVSKVIRLDAGLMIYISVILVVVVVQYYLSKSPGITNKLAKSVGLKNVSDLDPLLTGANAGMLGGQYFLIVKLLAEVTEAAIILPAETVDGGVVFVIVAVGIVVGGFHVETWRKGMELERGILFIPVYRFFFIISSLVASILVLREFYNSTSASIAIYVVGIALEFLFLIYVTRDGLRTVAREEFFQNDHRPTESQASSRRTGTKPHLVKSKSTSLIKHRTSSYDSAMASNHHDRRIRSKHKSASGPRRGSFDESSGLRRRETSHMDGDFNNTIMTPRRSVVFESDSDDGYRSVGSIHSEPGEVHIHEFHQRHNAEHNYEYTSPESVIVPKGAYNPWAPQGQSFYFDNASVPGTFKVRGPNYMEDGLKVKCEVSRMKLVMGELLLNPREPIRNICAHPSHFVQREHVGRADRPFLFVGRC